MKQRKAEAGRGRTWHGIYGLLFRSLGASGKRGMSNTREAKIVRRGEMKGDEFRKRAFVEACQTITLERAI